MSEKTATETMDTCSSSNTDEDGSEKEDDDDEEEEAEDTNNNYCEVCGGGSGELVCCDFCECAYHDFKCLNVKSDDLCDPWTCPQCAGNLPKIKADYKKRRKQRKLEESSLLLKNEGMQGAEGKVASHSKNRSRGTNKKRLITSLEESDDEVLGHDVAARPVLASPKGAAGKKQQVFSQAHAF